MIGKMIKNDEGFTLVEVIIVAVIVAVLASVAVPLYLNYVVTSRNEVASHTAGSVATFCAACQNGGGVVSGISGTPANNFNVLCTGGAGDGTRMTIPATINVSSSALVSPAIVTATYVATGATAQTANW